MTITKHFIVALVAVATLSLSFIANAAEIQTGQKEWCGPCKMLKGPQEEIMSGKVQASRSFSHAESDQPLAKTKAGRAQNRRVEINLKK